MNFALILSAFIASAFAIPLDSSNSTDQIAITTENVPDMKTTSSIEEHETSSERTDVFMNEELELLAINLHDIFRRDTSEVDVDFPMRATEQLSEMSPLDYLSYQPQESYFPQEEEVEGDMKKREIQQASYKDTHSPDPNFPKYLMKRKRRNTMFKL